MRYHRGMRGRISWRGTLRLLDGVIVLLVAMSTAALGSVKSVTQRNDEFRAYLVIMTRVTANSTRRHLYKK